MIGLGGLEGRRGMSLSFVGYLGWIGAGYRPREGMEGVCFPPRLEWTPQGSDTRDARLGRKMRCLVF